MICEKASKFSVDNLDFKFTHFVSKKELDEITEQYESGKHELEQLSEDLKKEVSLILIFKVQPLEARQHEADASGYPQGVEGARGELLEKNGRKTHQSSRDPGVA